MSKHKSRDVWNIVGSALVPFLDRRTGHDRRHEADAAHDGPSPWIDKRAALEKMVMPRARSMAAVSRNASP